MRLIAFVLSLMQFPFVARRKFEDLWDRARALEAVVTPRDDELRRQHAVIMAQAKLIASLRAERERVLRAFDGPAPPDTIQE